ncbi:serine/threonine protein kinase [Nonomuraea soli]|uniref:non-specific serine/threonine protein kinase n=1 Tax=Nonomuraea soli TaxID=1032476 RepID=A0A7W0CE18_9ACTN|nr:serine/threonine-protein kinase [Nonomuraea soli]MBA2889453.1 serine/threonine protein kinase [Nonomuraea soli]
MPSLRPLLPEDPPSVGPYQVHARLGSGGQGTVFAARGSDGASVAVKLLDPPLDGARDRFLDEVETAKRVAPFCTAQVLDSGFHGSRPYIVSEFVDGPSLQESVRDSGPRGAGALQRLAINTVTALAGIHAADVIHLDFKPGNVVLSPDGPVVIDFGIARAVDLTRSSISSQIVGTPAYMAPEQFAGGPVGAAADLFAWAATMVYAATGRHAFPGERIPALMHSIVYGEPDLGTLEDPLRGILLECLAKDASLRPSAASVAERLRALPAPAWQATVESARPPASTARPPAGPAHPPALTDRPPAVQAHPPAVPARPTQPSPAVQASAPGHHPRRLRRRLAWAGAVVLVATAGTGYALWPSDPITVPPASAATTTPSPTLNPVSPSPTTTPAHRDRQRQEPGKRKTAAPTSPARSPKGDTNPGPTAQTTKAAVQPEPTPDRTTARPSSKPSSKPSTKPTATQSPVPTSEPKAAESGTLVWADAEAFCAAKGGTAAGSWYNLSCITSGMDFYSPHQVCQWKYPGTTAGVPTGTQGSVDCRKS